MLDSTNSDPNFMNTIITREESWVYGYDPKIKSFRHFPYNENPRIALNTTSLKCCLTSTHAIDRQEKKLRMHMEVKGCLMEARFIEIHLVFAKKKSDTFLPEKDTHNMVVWCVLCS